MDSDNVTLTWRKYHADNNITQSITYSKYGLDVTNPCWPGKMSRAALYADILVNPDQPNCGISLEFPDGTYLTPFKRASY